MAVSEKKDSLITSSSSCDYLEQFNSDINKEYELFREEQRRMKEAALQALEQEASEDDNTDDENTEEEKIETIQEEYKKDDQINKENVRMFNNTQTSLERNTNDKDKNETFQSNNEQIELEKLFKNQCSVDGEVQNNIRNIKTVKASVLFSNKSVPRQTFQPTRIDVNRVNLKRIRDEEIKKTGTHNKSGPKGTLECDTSDARGTFIRRLSNEKLKMKLKSVENTSEMPNNFSSLNKNEKMILKDSSIDSYQDVIKRVSNEKLKKTDPKITEVRGDTHHINNQLLETRAEFATSPKEPDRQKETNKSKLLGHGQTFPFTTPSRVPPQYGAQSLPLKSRTKTDTNDENTDTPKPRIMCTIDMRSHLNTPLFQPQMKSSKTINKKRLLSTSTLNSVPEDEDVGATAFKPLAEKRVKDVFKCITVNDIEYIVLNELGKGGSSVVYHCYDPDGREEYAVKVVDLKQDTLGYINEVKALRRLQDCDRIIKLHQYQNLKEEKKLYMVLEKGGRDFAQILREHSRNAAHLPAFMVHFYWMQMLHAVRQMHSKGVIHSDLKPANFIEIRERLKLIDFGISSCVQLDMTSVVKTVALGTFGYISPEALCTDQAATMDRQAYKIGFRSDVWSLGCILYQLVFKRTPFAHIQHSSARLSTIMDPNHVIDYPPADWVPSGVIQCIRACLQYNARHRPTIEELIQAENSMKMAP